MEHVDGPRPPHLTERDRAMAAEIGRHAGQHVVARMIDLATDREFAQRVTGTYAEEAQRVVGAAVIRLAFWVVGVVMFVVAMKAGLLEKIAEVFRVGRP